MNSRVLAVVVLLLPALMLPLASAAATRDRGAGLTSISGLKGKDIRGPEGTRLGSVEDVLIGPGSDSTFIVLSRGSAFGEIGPFHPIPWRMAAPEIRKDAVVIAFGANTMEKAPAVRMEAWPPESLSPDFIAQVRLYYQQAGQAKTN